MYSYHYFDFFRDTAFCCGTDIFTAFYSGLVVFTIIGFMAKESGSSVDELARVSGRFFHEPFASLGMFHVFVVCWFVFFFQNRFQWKTLSGIPSACQTVQILFRPDSLSGLNVVQTLCKSYQQTKLVGNELTLPLLAATLSSGKNHCIQFEPISGPTYRTSDLIWVQTVGHSACVPESFLLKNLIIKTVSKWQ